MYYLMQNNFMLPIPPARKNRILDMILKYKPIFWPEVYPVHLKFIQVSS